MISSLAVISSSKMFRSLWQHSFSFPKTIRRQISKAATFEVVLPQKVSAQIKFDSLNVPLPPYAKTGQPPALSGQTEPEIKSPEAIEKMRKSCKLAKNILESVSDIIRVGQTTEEIDKFVHRMSIENNAYPSPLNYRGFPKSVCTSVNNCVCHGIPDDRPLADGDIVNVDVTVFLDGYHGDCSKTFLVGNVDSKGRKLVEVTEESLYVGISACGPGRPFRNIGSAIYENAKKFGFNVVPVFIGHGIGTYFHGPPDIYHIPSRYPGTMKPGMTFTIEPVLSEGSKNVIILEDGWTAVTEDQSRAAQFEETVLITETGVEILTV